MYFGRRTGSGTSFSSDLGRGYANDFSNFVWVDVKLVHAKTEARFVFGVNTGSTVA
ncbi:hypothetical protein IPG36_00145 [bacterium]|nr:MAG: hypothetical protein IPG36_00145 [bacterium]